MRYIDDKIMVLQQVLDPRGDGGVSAEYRALQNSSLQDKYHFEPMILTHWNAGVNLKDIWFYYKHIKNKRPDIVHIRGAAPDGLNAVLAAAFAGKTKILVTVHGMYSDLVYISPVKKWISKHIVEPLIFGCADGISCVYQAAEKREVFQKYRVKLLPHVYNRMPDYSVYAKDTVRHEMRSKLHIEHDAITGVYVGRVTKEKGLSILCDVFDRIDRDWPDNFEFIVVGDGDYRHEFQNKCNEMKNSSHVHFVGRQSEVYRYLFASDFFVLPSFHENHSISLLEAAAAGLPTIATGVGGNAEIVINGRTGIVIPPRKSAELEVAMKKMIGDQALRETFAAETKKMQYSQFQNENVDKQLDLVYSKLLDN